MKLPSPSASATPHTFAGICALAAEILPAHLATAIRQGKPVDDVTLYKFPASKWRRYDKLVRFPAGIVPFGDAVVSFSPTYAHGMTMTLLQAGHLRRALESPGADLATKLNRATAKGTYSVWIANAIADLTLHNASGPVPRWYRPAGVFFDWFRALQRGEAGRITLNP